MKFAMKNVLVIDDDEKICWAFEQFLTDEGHRPIVANNAEEGLRKIQSDTPDIILLDVRLPGMNGLEALKQIKVLQPEAIVIVMTAYDSVEMTIQAMQLHAFDFIPKPIDLDQVKAIIDRVSQMQVERNKMPPTELSSVELELPAQPQEHRLVGKSPQMQEIYKLIGMMANNTVTVLIEGESGTGKELIARSIHSNSVRKDKPFVPVNCGALPDDLLESELFGYEAGAFTGANAKGKPGRFELADGGTLFLDEVSNMSPVLQVKLQRALQEQEIERLGGTRPLKVDVRIIAATNQDLAEVVRLGRFREDLYYRFNLLSINLPPLRERSADITLLVNHFLQTASVELGQTVRGVSPRCLALLQQYDWPGNVRELENAVKSAAVLSRTDVLLPEHLPTEILNYKGRQQSSQSRLEVALESVLKETVKDAVTRAHEALYDEVIDAVDRTLIKNLLEEVQDNQTKSAKVLGISRTTLLQKIKKLEIEMNA
jgi:two-component system nitrogen regulation response regulator GlnG